MCDITYSGMSGEQVPMHPFSIMCKLSPEFGYPRAFQSHCYAATSFFIEAVAVYVRCLATLPGTFHEESVGAHPFVITTAPLPECCAPPHCI